LVFDMEVITKSARETEELGQKLAVSLKKGKIIGLYGELGSGKTTFVKGLAKGLGIKERIVSPTFVFIRPYACRQTKGSFYHVDLYRLEGSQDAQGLGLEEIFAERKAIVVIEWAGKIKGILPKKRIDIFFEYHKENERKVIIKRE